MPALNLQALNLHKPNAWRPKASLASLQARARVLTQLREFFAARQVLEVQTPLLGCSTVTDPDVESISVPGYGYLQTSPEYFMKRLLAAGVPSCYQIASAFRHDEQGRLHNCEFTMLEWYRTGFDDHDLMQEVSEVVDMVLGPTTYATRAYAELVEDLAAPRDVLDLQFSQACEALGPGRVFIVDYPADQAALAQVRREDPRYAARFELIIDGVEIANGYWELLDPHEHRRRFNEDLRTREQRGLSQPSIDVLFLEALEHGLPACAGVAVGLDRLLMLQQNSNSLDETLSFRR